MKPRVQALLLADRVYRDQTGKHIIAGTFNKLVFKKNANKPKTIVEDGEERTVVLGGIQAGSPSAYINLTEIRGTVDCVLRYVNLADDSALIQCKFTVKGENPLDALELVLPMPSLPTIAGVFALELLCEDEPIGSLRIIVEELRDEENDNPNN